MADVIEIFAIAHTSRSQDYWRTRLKKEYTKARLTPNRPCTTRGCQVRRRHLREFPRQAIHRSLRRRHVPRAFRRAATWPGSSCTVLCVNQPMPCAERLLPQLHPAAVLRRLHQHNEQPLNIGGGNRRKNRFGGGHGGRAKAGGTSEIRISTACILSVCTHNVNAVNSFAADKDVPLPHRKNYFRTPSMASLLACCSSNAHNFPSDHPQNDLRLNIILAQDYWQFRKTRSQIAVH